jgi:ATP-dependent 26S proteasome regulatory subunit
LSDEPTQGTTGETLQDLFETRRADTGRGRQLLSRVVSMVEAGEGFDQTSVLVHQLRQLPDEQHGKELDQYLFERISSFDCARQELETIHSELQEQLEHLLSPPFFPSRYLGKVATSRGAYANVLHAGTRRLVAFGDGVGVDDLVVGDEVYLCREQNIVMEKARVRSPQTGETSAMVRQIDEERIVVAERDTEVVLSVGDELDTETLRPGDLVLWDRSANIALGRLEPGSELGFEDIDSTPRGQLGGLDQLRDDVIARFVFTISDPDLARNYGILNEGAQRLLLQGPPGTGKTTLMRIVASRIAKETNQNCRVVSISGAELYSSYVGETERNIRRCFAILNDYEGPGIVFFDEIDAIGRARGHAAGYHDDRFLGTLLAEMEGMRRSDVAVIAATNRADALDPALRGRFSWELEIPRPNMAAARQIFSVHLSDDIPYRPNGAKAPDTRHALIEAGVAGLYEPNTDNMIASLQFRDGKRRDIAACDLMSGRLIEQICVATRSKAFGRHCRGGQSGVSIADMQAAVADAIDRLRNTLSTQNVGCYLHDLPQDVDVVAVDPYQPRTNAQKYAR